MEPSDKSNSESRNKEIEKRDHEVKAGTDRESDIQAQEPKIAPFSEHDPFRAARISTLNSEANRLLGQISKESSLPEDASIDELKQFYQDAEERAMWSQTEQDVFVGFLRLGFGVPPRSERIL